MADAVLAGPTPSGLRCRLAAELGPMVIEVGWAKQADDRRGLDRDEQANAIANLVGCRHLASA